MLDKFKNITPQLFFIYAAIVFFVVFNIATPPLQVPDEFNHFYRTYQLAEGQLLPNKINHRLGGEIPNCINEYFFPLYNTATEMRITASKKDILEGFKIKYTQDTITQFKDFPNTSYYSLVSYLPQVVAIFITKKLNCSIATMYYAGRLLVFLTWLVCMFFVIKTIPIYKWLIVLLCLLPMNIFITSSFSADAVSNILSFLFIALVLKYTFTENKFQLKNLASLLIIISLLALAKVVYAALVLSFLIIPIKNFKDKTQYFLFAGILFFVAAVVASYWSGIVMRYYTPYADYNPSYREWICLTHNSNYYQQKAYILNHGTYFLKVIYRSIFNHPSTFLDGYIGRFGNNEIFLPEWLLWLTYIVLIFITLFEKNKFTFTIQQKIILVSSSFIAFVLLLLSQHLTWDAVGEGVVDLIQGRYLIPLFPFIFFSMGNYKFQGNINYGLIFVPLFIILYTVSTYQIVNRYYIGKGIEYAELTCNVENSNHEGLLTTSNPTYFIQAGTTTDSIARSGKSSILLSEQSPYGLTFKFSNLNYGDVVEASVWEKGQGAQLVIAGKEGSCEKFYQQNGDVYYYDKKGWKRLYMKFLMTEKCANSTFQFYVWNPGKTKIYLDDLKFSIKKFAP